MLAEAIIENNEMRVINFPKDMLKCKHWQIDIKPIKEIVDDNKNDLNYFDKFQIDFSNYHFNRDEANER